jgi:hypothetical protein
MIYPYPDCGSPQERNRFPFHGAPIQAKDCDARDRDHGIVIANAARVFSE